MKILLVDDEPDMLELMELHFNRAGYTVLTAANGLDALTLARRTEPDCIVLDFLLPDLDGLTLCEILRRQAPTCRIPILILTAVGGQMARLSAIEAGADDYLVKPVPMEFLLRRVREFPALQANRCRAGATPGNDNQCP